MNIEVPLEGLTWGELRAFVALSTETDETEVLYEYDTEGQYERLGMVLVGVNPKRIGGTGGA